MKSRDIFRNSGAEIGRALIVPLASDLLRKDSVRSLRRQFLTVEKRRELKKTGTIVNPKLPIPQE